MGNLAVFDVHDYLSMRIRTPHTLSPQPRAVSSNQQSQTRPKPSGCTLPLEAVGVGHRMPAVIDCGTTSQSSTCKEDPDSPDPPATTHSPGTGVRVVGLIPGLAGSTPGQSVSSNGQHLRCRSRTPANPVPASVPRCGSRARISLSPRIRGSPRPAAPLQRGKRVVPTMTPGKQ